MRAHASIAAAAILALSAARPPEARPELSRGELAFDVRPDMSVRLMLKEGSVRLTVGTLLPPRVFRNSGTWRGTAVLRSFAFDPEKAGGRDRLRLSGELTLGDGDTRDIVTILEFQDAFPMSFVVSSLIQAGDTAGIDSLESCSLEVPAIAGGDSTWSFQGGSYSNRPDWIFPVGPGYSRRNFQGMNAPDYGGGIPLVDLWTRRSGLALASAAVRPEPVALPVSVDATGMARMSLVSGTAGSRGELVTAQSVVIVHRGDFFNALAMYARVMRARGIAPAASPAGAHDVEWCGWGYERSFEPSQVLASLPAARSIGAGWATVDDGWQSADGDWDPDPVKFPGGDSSMKALTDSIHAAGLKARLWWVPLEAHDSAYSAAHYPGRAGEFGMRFASTLSAVHPEWFQLNADGSRTQVSWWNSYTLCPAVPAVRAHYVGVVKRMIAAWGFDGVKIDGQNMNGVPPCYNAAHGHASPEDAPRGLPGFFEAIYSEIKAANPMAVVHLCPCGTNFSFYHIPYADQTVASDPLSSWQVRHRGKAFKALLGPSAPYSGDHVELTSHRWDEASGRSVVTGIEDFASTIGVGGVISTKFTVPGVRQADSSLMLGIDKEKRYGEWILLANRLRLSEGEYRNLYDIAFDEPETHVIQKKDTMFYCLFAENGFEGTVQFRGLAEGSYQITDVLTGRSLGMTTTSPALKLSFRGAMILRAEPK